MFNAWVLLNTELWLCTLIHMLIIIRDNGSEKIYVHIFSKALKCMVDFICGDFNQFANRQFSRETGGSIFGGIVLEVLEDAIRALNQQLWRENWISFNISSSSAPQDVFDSVFANNHNEMDCMLCISLFYNKQKFQVDRPPALTNEFSMSQDYHPQRIRTTATIDRL